MMSVKGIDRYLQGVEKPQRYINSEFNVIKKPWDEARVRICLAFPDVYEVGMSYHGFSILYDIVNSYEHYLAERAYTPWPDFEEILRERKISLFSLESRSRLSDFDIIGFTLPHELNYTNVLTMLDLAGIPLESSQRSDEYPLIIGGGECALSPEPMSLFFDAFVLGDGENIIIEILNVIETAKQRADIIRKDVLAALQELNGVYIPSFYEFIYSEDGDIIEFKAREDAPPVAHRKYSFIREIVSLQKAWKIKSPLIPLMRIVQDRSVVEIRRGCTAGCRFCRAGMINRPVRERPPEQIINLAHDQIKASGYDEISLLSLNTADYSLLAELLDNLQRCMKKEGVSIALPSLRISGFDISLAENLAGIRKSGLTFAPETGSERLARVINKVWDRKEFMRIVEDLVGRGWRTLKLYFMIGFPTETLEDLDGIINIIKEVDQRGRSRYGAKFQINITISPFVPKPHTPFQWVGQMPLRDLRQRLTYIRKNLRSKTVSIKETDIEQSYIEAIVSRGDRRMASVILKAWQNGAQFDNWKEHFDLRLWLDAIEHSGYDPAWYATRSFGYNQILPWDHIDTGVERQYLIDEYQKALNETLTTDCTKTGLCTGCGICQSYEIGNEIASSMQSEAIDELESFRELSDLQQNPSNRIRVYYQKKGRMRFLSHLDMIKVLNLLLRQAALPLAYSSGFNPQPRMQFAPPLPLGYEGDEEIFDILLHSAIDVPGVIDILNRRAPEGLTIKNLEPIALHSPSPDSIAESADYVIILPKDKILKQEAINIRGLISHFIQKKADELVVGMNISLRQNEYQNPLKILSMLAGRQIIPMDTLYLCRQKIYLKHT